MLPKKVDLVEVGPREGFQFEGIGQPDKIPAADKVKLIEALANTGLKVIQAAAFVHPKQVPQMADAEAIFAALRPPPAGVQYTGAYLNDVGIKRALATGKVAIVGGVTLTASETFARQNQKRTLEEDLAMARKVAALYRDNNYKVEQGSIMAAFGCNFEGDIPLERVLKLIGDIHNIAEETGSTLRNLILGDTMGWANPEQVRRTIGSIRERWPSLRVRLHLHDTRGLAIANVYAALLEGIDHFDSAVAGLGGCPFAGHQGAAGNVCTEEVVFLCQEIGIETGVDLDKLVDCARLAEEIVGHPVPSALVHKTNLNRASIRMAS